MPPMFSSRDIDALRSDVAANCRKLIELAAEQGYDVLVTDTVRDAEFQMKCYNNGTSKARCRPSTAPKQGSRSTSART